jgi:hypothetical protein
LHGKHSESLRLAKTSEKRYPQILQMTQIKEDLKRIERFTGCELEPHLLFLYLRNLRHLWMSPLLFLFGCGRGRPVFGLLLGEASAAPNPSSPRPPRNREIPDRDVRDFLCTLGGGKNPRGGGPSLESSRYTGGDDFAGTGPARDLAFQGLPQMTSSRNTPMLRRTLSALLIVTAVLVVRPALAADNPLEAFPSNTSLIVRFKKPQATIEKVASLVDAVAPGQGAMVRISSAGLGAVIANQTQEGVDRNADWWLGVFVSPESEPALVYAIPAKDAKAMEEALGADVTFIKYEKWGIYCDKEDAAARIKTQIKDKGDSINDVMDKHATAVMDQAELSVFINVGELMEAYETQLEAAKGQLEAALEGGAAPGVGAPGVDSQAVFSFMGQFLGALLQGLEDTESCTLGLAVSKQGIGLEQYAAVTADSATGKWLKANGGTDMKSLASLPPSLIYYGLHGSPSTLMSASLGMMKSLVKDDEDAQKALEGLQKDYADLEQVGAAAAEDRIVAVLAAHRIAAGAEDAGVGGIAVQQVVPLAPRQAVVAVAPDQRVDIVAAVEAVVAGRAVERVEAPVAVESVVAVVADDRVVPRAAEQVVVAGAPVERVVACLRIEEVVAVAAGEAVLSVAANNAVVAGIARQGVVAVAAVEAVIAIAARHAVVTVAGDEGIVAGVAEDGVLTVPCIQAVVAGAAVDRIAAVAAPNDVAEFAAGDRVGPVAPGDRDSHQVGEVGRQHPREVDAVAPRPAGDRDRLHL